MLALRGFAKETRAGRFELELVASLVFASLDTAGLLLSVLPCKVVVGVIAISGGGGRRVKEAERLWRAKFVLLPEEMDEAAGVGRNELVGGVGLAVVLCRAGGNAVGGAAEVRDGRPVTV